MRPLAGVHSPHALYFNPRTHVGCDSLSHPGKSSGSKFQSTHPRGVRHTMGAATPKMYRFQSTHPRGVRLLEFSYLHSDIQFQSTHPRGVRRILPGTFSGFPDFQSTHPRGVRRHISASCLCATDRFQSTHPRGVRPFGEISFTDLTHFNPRTHVGCDNFLQRLEQISNISIHAPTWGAT